MVIIQVPKRTTIPSRLGPMDELLVQIYDHGSKTENTSGREDQSNPQNLALVLQQGKRGAVPHQWDN